MCKRRVFDARVQVSVKVGWRNAYTRGVVIIWTMGNVDSSRRNSRVNLTFTVYTEIFRNFARASPLCGCSPNALRMMDGGVQESFNE